MQDAVGSDDEAMEALSEFTVLFAAYRHGHYTLPVVRNLAVELLNDCAPATIEDFLAICDACATSDAWAGVVESAAAERDLDMASGQLMAASAPLGTDRGSDGRMEEGRGYAELERAESMARAHSWRHSRDRGTAGACDAAAAAPARHERRHMRGRGSRGSHREKKGKDWLKAAKNLVPYGRGTYAIWFTIINMAVIVGAFAYMAGDYAMWARRHTFKFAQYVADTEAEREQYLQDIESLSGKVPEYTKAWLTWSPSWQAFQTEFLQLWGGRYGPSLKDGQWWLWLTSIYLHRDLQHIVSNMLLFVAMSVHLELNYGWWRLVLVWIMSGVGGNLVSGLFESYCTTLVGASGAVFGFMGLFVADLIVNFESIAWPFVRAATIVLFLVFFIVNAVVERSTAGNVSHASHIGGLVCGLFPSMLFLPNLRDRRLAAMRRQTADRARSSRLSDGTPARQTEASNHGLKPSFWSKFPVNPLRVLGAIVVSVVYIVFPIIIYTIKFDETCDDVSRSVGQPPRVPGSRRLAHDAAPSNGEGKTLRC